mmetsp:Transcript_3079/g.6960  ORF Transcript_3079/g.6960 Transcript_3079/m.6960 type:complete len:206 (+) Transcript_3079:613-1230(+)
MRRCSSYNSRITWGLVVSASTAGSSSSVRSRGAALAIDGGTAALTSRLRSTLTRNPSSVRPAASILSAFITPLRFCSYDSWSTRWILRAPIFLVLCQTSTVPRLFWNLGRISSSALAPVSVTAEWVFLALSGTFSDALSNSWTVSGRRASHCSPKCSVLVLVSMRVFQNGTVMTLCASSHAGLNWEAAASMVSGLQNVSCLCCTR